MRAKDFNPHEQTAAKTFVSGKQGEERHRADFIDLKPGGRVLDPQAKIAL